VPYLLRIDAVRTSLDAQTRELKSLLGSAQQGGRYTPPSSDCEPGCARRPPGFAPLAQCRFY